MAKRGEIREIFADMEDIELTFDSEFASSIEMDETMFFLRRRLNDEKQVIYLCWNRQMTLLEPGKLDSHVFGSLDYRDAARRGLERYIDGLSNCTISVLYGQLWPMDRCHQGVPTFELLSPREANDVLVVAGWPADRPPIYDMAPDGHFASNLHAKLIYREWPNPETVHGAGYDLWVIPKAQLGSEFARAAEDWDMFHYCIKQDNWRNFDLRRAYYRQKMQSLQWENPIQSIFRFEFTDDYVTLTMSSGDNGIKYWYTEDGLMCLCDLWAKTTAIAQILQADFGCVEDVN